MPTILPDGLHISAYLPREDVHDALICVKAKTLADLPAGAVIGTAALRRQAQLRRLRPDFNIVLLRGNLPTRIAKVTSGELDATFLALAGLKRLGLTEHVASVLSDEDFLPAVGQGAICIESCIDDTETSALLAPINHAPTADELTLERAFLKVLDGSCRTPIAGHATVAGERIIFRGEIILPDGSETHAITTEGPRADAATLGQQAGEALKAKAGPDFLKKLG
jgi:hydroxymethylbilane synthase